MPSTVLIARPHPFIVSSMKPFLEEMGYSVTKLDRVSELAEPAPRASGVVISLALSSPIPESAEEVFSQLRRVAPHTPVLFASMLNADLAAHSLEQISKRHGFQALVISANSPATAWAGLGKQETFLYLSKEDIEAQASRSLLQQMVQRHFR